MYKDIKERTYEFALRIIRVSKVLYAKRENYVLANKVFRSGTSIGANVEEAVASRSRDEYIFKMTVALKEARETQYWLRLISGSRTVDPRRLKNIIGEAEEIKKVLGAIVAKMRKTSKHDFNREPHD